MEYDSSKETKEHIKTVAGFIRDLLIKLRHRIIYHDVSKLEPPEKQIFDVVTPKLKGLTYGSDEYKKSLNEMGEALKHHYAENLHHPEHFKNGIDDMDLIDIIEMVCDWKAATLRHADGDIIKSVEINTKRFNISPQLSTIISTSIRNWGWEKRNVGRDTCKLEKDHSGDL